ncbi:MAG TPA: nucleotidyltransferase domain-containing protein [Actinomycetota bacterium]|nr:nucleotidyltransferase domain-containing protein [Actinomycetota bacterium]
MAARPDAVGAALVGSHARGQARADSDVDLMIVTTSPGGYLSDTSWTRAFGETESVEVEEWGAVTSVRVRYVMGAEVEFGITTPEWTKTSPIDPGTKRVVQAGFRILLDRDGSLRALHEECADHASYKD